MLLTDDRTYYYEVFPSNNLELALWMESERLHPIINQIGRHAERGYQGRKELSLQTNLMEKSYPS
jgi:hypothetical protein